MLPKSVLRSGVSSYLAAISTIRAAFADTLIFHSTYDSDAIGDPTQRAIASKVRLVALLSKGACSKVPITGRIHVVIVLDTSLHG